MKKNILSKKKQKPLAHIQPRCRAVSIIELKTLMPFAEKTLAAREKKRFQKMGPKRKRSFLAARLACKRISRMLSGNGGQMKKVMMERGMIRNEIRMATVLIL